MIVIIFILLIMIFWSLPWLVHKTMSQDPKAKRIIKFASFKKFKKEFYKIEWVRDVNNKESLFHKDTYNIDKNFIHADICIINGISYQFDPISYILYRIFLYKNRTTEKNKNKTVNSLKEIRKIKLKKIS